MHFEYAKSFKYRKLIRFPFWGKLGMGQAREVQEEYVISVKIFIIFVL